MHITSNFSIVKLEICIEFTKSETESFTSISGAAEKQPNLRTSLLPKAKFSNLNIFF